MHCFYSETNEWLKDLATRRARLWSVTSCRELHKKYPFLTRKISVVTAQNLQCIKIFLTLELGQHSRSGSRWALFPKASQSRPAATASDSGTPCVCDSPSDPSKLCQGAALRAWPLILRSKPSIVFWNSLREWLPDDRQRLELGLKLELYRLTSDQRRFYLPQNPNINCVEFEFCLGPLKISKSRQVVSPFQPSSPRLAGPPYWASLSHHCQSGAVTIAALASLRKIRRS